MRAASLSRDCDIVADCCDGRPREWVSRSSRTRAADINREPISLPDIVRNFDKRCAALVNVTDLNKCPCAIYPASGRLE